MPIFIYNSLTRKKELFEPVEKGKVGMYVCGPTVYDEPHIGHARSAYIFDLIRRYLKYRGYEVKFVRNVTDVDDKIIEKAKQEYENEDLNAAVKKVSDKYLKSYQECMSKLGIQAPDLEPRATEYIEKMKSFIKILIERGMAYEADGDVYFDIKKAKKYGELSHQSLENMPACRTGREAGTRIAPGENKKDPLDFALWKKAKESEPSWDSDWGKGRPGWHIECSVMSSDILGDEFDIHGGGLDLIFPHHENEKAQSEGAGKKFARYWIHHGLLTINGQKMSKSLGNFISIQEALKKYNSDDLKLFFLSAHYASPIDFSEQNMLGYHKAIQRFEILFQKIVNLKMPFKNKKILKIDFIERNKDDFLKAMDDDFNAPRALSYLFDLVKETNILIDSGTKNEYFYSSIDQAGSLIGDLCRKIFGLSIIGFIGGDSIAESKLLDEREKARAIKDFKRSDALREELKKKGIIVEDTKDGQAWRREL